MPATLRGPGSRLHWCRFAPVLQPGPFVVSDGRARFASQTFPEGSAAWQAARGALFAGSEIRSDCYRGTGFAPCVYAASAPRLVARFDALRQAGRLGFTLGFAGAVVVALRQAGRGALSKRPVGLSKRPVGLSKRPVDGMPAEVGEEGVGS